jgi:hypothetical protein
MSTRYWIVGGEYEGADFRSLIPGSETMSGPFEDERKARNEWLRLTYRPGTDAATIRYSIAAEPFHG